MKKLPYVIPLAALLVALTIAFAGAGMEYEDPALCVEGKWLLVNAAHPSAIRVTVPEDARYGDQQAGGCQTSMPGIPLIQVVKERGEHHIMRVWVDGSQATTPTVTATYGDAVRVKHNSGRGNLNFLFVVR